MKAQHKIIRRSQMEADRAERLADEKYNGNQSLMYRDLLNIEYYRVFGK